VANYRENQSAGQVLGGFSQQIYNTPAGLKYEKSRMAAAFPARLP